MIVPFEIAVGIWKKSTFRTKAIHFTFARNVDFSFIVSGSERTFTFCVPLNALPTLATLVRRYLDPKISLMRLFKLDCRSL